MIAKEESEANGPFTRRSPSVNVQPTLIWLTRMRAVLRSDAAFFVSVISPPLDTE